MFGSRRRCWERVRNDDDGSSGMYKATALARRAMSEIGPSAALAGGRAYSKVRRGNREASTRAGHVSGSMFVETAWRTQARVAQRSFKVGLVAGNGAGTAAFARKAKQSLREGMEIF